MKKKCDMLFISSGQKICLKMFFKNPRNSYNSYLDLFKLSTPGTMSKN